MTRVHRRFVLGIGMLTAVSLFAACTEAQTLAPNYRQETIEYAKPDGASLAFDIAYPAVAPSRLLPAIVFVHGGGWRQGDRSEGLPLLPALTADGKYVVATIDYRLTTVAKWPAQIHDCKAAIRYLKANAARFHLDPDRIGVWGSSAGGHLAALLGTTAGIRELDGSDSVDASASRVACIVDFCGPSDLRTVHEGLSGLMAIQIPSLVAQLLGEPAARNPEAAKSASPIAYISADDPPFLIVHGTADPVVPFAQSQTFHDALRKAGVDSMLIPVVNAEHNIAHPRVFERTLQFFDRHLCGYKVEIPTDTITADSKKK